MRITESRLRRIIRSVLAESYGMRSTYVDMWMRDSETLKMLKNIVGKECVYRPGTDHAVIMCDFGNGEENLIALQGTTVYLYIEKLSESQAEKLKQTIRSTPAIVGSDNFKTDCTGVLVHDGHLTSNLR